MAVGITLLFQKALRDLKVLQSKCHYVSSFAWGNCWALSFFSAMIATPEQFGPKLVWSQVNLKELTFQWLFRSQTITASMLKTWFCIQGWTCFCPDRFSLSLLNTFSVERNSLTAQQSQKHIKTSGWGRIEIGFLLKSFLSSNGCRCIQNKPQRSTFQTGCHDNLLSPGYCRFLFSICFITLQLQWTLVWCHFEWRHRPSEPGRCARSTGCLFLFSNKVSIPLTYKHWPFTQSPTMLLDFCSLQCSICSTLLTWVCIKKTQKKPTRRQSLHSAS